MPGQLELPAEWALSMIVPDDQAKVGPTSITPPSLLLPLSFSSPLVLLFLATKGPFFKPSSFFITSYLHRHFGPPVPSLFTEPEPRHIHALFFHSVFVSNTFFFLSVDPEKIHDTKAVEYGLDRSRYERKRTIIITRFF